MFSLAIKERYLQDNAILDEIIEFNETYSHLFTIDALTAMPAAISAFLLITGSLSLFGGVVIGTGLYFGREGLFDRSSCRDEFIGKFNNLKKCYDTYCENNDVIITCDKTFLKLLKAILPYVADAKTLVPEKWFKNAEDISQLFRDILAAPPHHYVLPAFPKTEPSLVTKVSRYIASFFAESKVTKHQNITKSSHSMPSMFADSLARTKRAIYGIDDILKKEKWAKEHKHPADKKRSSLEEADRKLKNAKQFIIRR
ncbi:MAG: hypothetical protein ACD_45C00215G0006 [uncultured bacterium]|nr:MAG: hypothetical protein ACD_45C00215G0006 [uncultured bacterium]